MAAVENMYRGGSGCVIKYPPPHPGKLGEDRSPYPYPFENHVASPYCPIQRSICVNGCESGEDDDEPEAENLQVRVPQASTQDAPPVNAMDLELPLLTRQASVVEYEDCGDGDGNGDGDGDGYIYICLRCPIEGVCISCGHVAT
jgi:hypothetical protein